MPRQALPTAKAHRYKSSRKRASIIPTDIDARNCKEVRSAALTLRAERNREKLMQRRVR